jgi:hypothetical protein
MHAAAPDVSMSDLLMGMSSSRSHYAMHIHQRRQYSKKLSVARGPEFNILPCALGSAQHFAGRKSGRTIFSLLSLC